MTAADVLMREGSGLFRGARPVTDWPTIRTFVLDRDDGLCQYCHLRAATDADHIWPRRLGGTDHIDNLRAACGPCNKAKGDRVDLARASIVELMVGIQSLGARANALEDEIGTLARYALSSPARLQITDLVWLECELFLLRANSRYTLDGVRAAIEGAKTIAAVPNAAVHDITSVDDGGTAA